MKKALIIFVKNAIPGKTKTRLAASIGNEKAIAIYNSLVNHTIEVSDTVAADKYIFFSAYLTDIKKAKGESFIVQKQSGNDLGERMKNAFTYVFEKGYDAAVVIGTDCPGIKKEIIENAFYKLMDSDVVIGPALDGGYYLLGTHAPHNFLFEDISWSTDQVKEETINRCKENNQRYELLVPLADVDEEKDLVHFYKYIKLPAV